MSKIVVDLVEFKQSEKLLLKTAGLMMFCLLADVSPNAFRYAYMSSRQSLDTQGTLAAVLQTKCSCTERYLPAIIVAPPEIGKDCRQVCFTSRPEVSNNLPKHGNFLNALAGNCAAPAALGYWSDSQNPGLTAGATLVPRLRR